MAINYEQPNHEEAQAAEEFEASQKQKEEGGINETKDGRKIETVDEQFILSKYELNWSGKGRPDEEYNNASKYARGAEKALKSPYVRGFEGLRAIIPEDEPRRGEPVIISPHITDGERTFISLCEYEANGYVGKIDQNVSSVDDLENVVQLLAETGYYFPNDEAEKLIERAKVEAMENIIRLGKSIDDITKCFEKMDADKQY